MSGTFISVLPVNDPELIVTPVDISKSGPETLPKVFLKSILMSKSFDTFEVTLNVAFTDPGSYVADRF